MVRPPDLVLTRSSRERFDRSLEANRKLPINASSSLKAYEGRCPFCHLRKADLIVHIDLIRFSDEILASTNGHGTDLPRFDYNAQIQSRLLNLPQDVLVYLLDNHLPAIYRPNFAMTCKVVAKVCKDHGLLRYNIPLSPALQPPRCSCQKGKPDPRSVAPEPRALDRKIRAAYSNTLSEMGPHSINLFFSIFIYKEKVASELSRVDLQRCSREDISYLPVHLRMKPYFWLLFTSTPSFHHTRCEMALNKNVNIIQEITSLSLRAIRAADTVGVRNLVWCTGMETCELVGKIGGGFRIKNEFQSGCQQADMTERRTT